MLPLMMWILLFLNLVSMCFQAYRVWGASGAVALLNLAAVIVSAIVLFATKGV